MAVAPKTTDGRLPSVKARIKELRKNYQAAQTSLNAQLVKASLTPYQKFRLKEHKAQVDAIITALNAEIESLAGGIVPLAYQEGISLTRIALENQGMDLPDGLNMGNKLHANAIQAVSDQMAMDLLEANGTLSGHANRILKQVKAAKLDESTVNTAISQGLVEGQTLKQTSKRLQGDIQKAIGEGAKVKVHCKDGKTRHYDPAYYAEMVAQTRTREASTEGNINGALEFGIKLFQVSIHEGACDYCVPRQGKVYSIEANDEGWPILDEKPPFHPWCEHVLTAFVEEAKDTAEVEALKDVSDDETFEIKTSAGYRKLIDGAKEKEPTKVITTSSFNLLANRYAVEARGFGDATEAVRDIAASAIKIARRGGLYVPEEIIATPDVLGIHKGPHITTPAAYRSGKVYINTESDYWLNAAKEARRADTFGQWSTGLPEHPILHEFAHGEHDLNAREFFLPTEFPGWEVVRDTVASGVSDRACDDIAEFVAEVRVGLVAEKDYPSDVLAWYTYFGGVK